MHLSVSLLFQPSSDLLSTWKLNAFTCFAASSWGERIVEVDACGVQLVFGKHGFDYWYFYLRFCMFGIYLMCQFHWELDCVGFSPFEIWRCGCVEMMRGIGGEGFLFSILGYRRGIAGNTWVVLSCRCCYCRFTLTVVVVKLASHCVFQQNHSK